MIDFKVGKDAIRDCRPQVLSECGSVNYNIKHAAFNSLINIILKKARQDTARKAVICWLPHNTSQEKVQEHCLHIFSRFPVTAYV